MEQAKSLVVRERVVTALALASKVQPKNRREDWATEGLQSRIARLCASILTVESFTAGDLAVPVVAVGYDAGRRRVR